MHNTCRCRIIGNRPHWLAAHGYYMSPVDKAEEQKSLMDNNILPDKAMAIQFQIPHKNIELDKHRRLLAPLSLRKTLAHISAE